jgi:microcystin-dependent protein
MAEPFIGEIRPWALNYAPMGWAFCNGQLMQAAQNQPLFAVIGITYGGNGSTTFNLPNLEGRVPMHFGQGNGLTPRGIGQTYGVSTVTLTESQTPSHVHTLTAQDLDGNSTAPGGNFLAKSNAEGPRGKVAYNTYAPPAVQTPMASTALGAVGGNQAHDNVQPILAVNMCIALIGIFPVRS